MNRELMKAQQCVPGHHQHINGGIDLSRRAFFQLAGLGLTGWFITGGSLPVTAQSAAVKLIDTARYCIYVHLLGGASHVDTFDLKEGRWTPADFQATSYNDVRWPAGLMPRLAEQLPRIAIVRSLSAYALVHELSQVWNQIGRNPTNILAKIAPNIGSVVALEYESRRAAKRLLPAFIGLNAGGSAYGRGYLPAQFAPFNITPNHEGIFGTTHPAGEESFQRKFAALQALDAEVRGGAPFGAGAAAMATAYEQGRALMYDPQIDAVFKVSSQDSAAYGNSQFGNACLIARNLIREDLGSHFIQINHANWDHHSDIYNQAMGGIYQSARQLDEGLGRLIADLAALPSKADASRTLLDETLIVVMGEFGRTVGELNNQRGRDHHLQMSALFAGAGIRGGRAIGKTDAQGAATIDTGWPRGLDMRPEDVFCTIYSALGIDYTTVRTDDPLKRGFEYVPYAKDGLYAPIDVLW